MKCQMGLLRKLSAVLVTLAQGGSQERCWPEQKDDGAIDRRIWDLEELRACIQISRCPCELSRQIALLKTNSIIISSLHTALRIKPKLLPLAVKALCDLARGPC